VAKNGPTRPAFLKHDVFPSVKLMNLKLYHQRVIESIALLDQTAFTYQRPVFSGGGRGLQLVPRETNADLTQYSVETQDAGVISSALPAPRRRFQHSD
jgi:hypothetical protein